MKSILATALLLIGLAVNAQPKPETPNAPREGREIATAALSTLRSMANAENAAGLGFDSPREAEAAAIDEPLAVYVVRLDDLRALQAGQDASALLRPAQRWIYPVSVGGRVRSSITLERAGDKLVATGFGGAKLTAALTRYRDESARSSGAPPASHFVVQVAALGVYLVARPSATGVIVTPIVDDPRGEFEAGRSLPLADAMLRLGDAARLYNGLPL